MYRRFNKQEEPVSTEIIPGKNYTNSELTAIADQLLRDDSHAEMCPECGERGRTTGKAETVPEGIPDGSGNELNLKFEEYACDNGHHWYPGEGKERGIGGDNPILFEEHFQSRKRREIYCVDSGTECVTQRLGWTSIDELREGDVILGFDPETRQTYWESPKEIFCEEYTGPMIRLFGRGIDSISTPDHRWPIEIFKKNGESYFETLTSSTLPMAKAAIWKGAPHADAPKQEIYSDAFVRLVAWHITEGHVWGRENSPRIAITQSHTVHGDYVDSIRSDLEEIEAEFSSPEHSLGMERREGLHCRVQVIASNSTQFVLSGTGVDQFLHVTDRNKVPSMNFLLNLSDRQLTMFSETLLFGDGDDVKTFWQWNEERRDRLTVAFTLAGYATSIDARGDTCKLYHAGERNAKKWISRLHREEIAYEGVVWCPVLECGHWVARRNGKTFITGNTAQGTPDPSIVSGMYNRVHPQGRKVNSKEQRQKNGASFYR